MTNLIQEIENQILKAKTTITPKNVGKIVEMGDGVVKVSGLSDVSASEIVSFPYGIKGLALNLEEDSVGCIIFGDWTKLKEGDECETTGKILEAPVGDELIGRVINPLGEAIDGQGAIGTKKFYPAEKIAPGVIFRQPVEVPLQTGIKAIDSMIPIGRGQRELIIGDRGLGKTAICIDTIINQTDVICIYCAIGQKTSKVVQTVSALEERGAMKHTIIVSASSSDPASMQYIAPYIACAIGEYFMDQGKDALVIYDDLTKHAWSYRQISLLLGRPSGREAYPGDIFYLHSRLLERAARLSADQGGGSLTALPIIETQAGDVSAYIPTNVISITDGQIFLETDLFYKGIRPAVNVGLSVSRVGGSAQIKAMKKVAGTLKLDLAQFRELEAFAQFGSDLDEGTKRQLERGKRAVELLKQTQYSPIITVNQVISLYALVKGYMDDIPLPQIKAYETELISYVETNGSQFIKDVQEKNMYSDESEELLKKLIVESKEQFLSK
jgi:F-type H+-transporting ATPase subunit alpha